MTKKILTLLCLTFSLTLLSQQSLEEKNGRVIDTLSTLVEGYSNELQMNVSNISMFEFLNSIAYENKINLTVNPSLTQYINYNFYKVSVRDVFVYLSSIYSIEFSRVGTILYVDQYNAPSPQKEPFSPKPLLISYDSLVNTISMDLKEDSLRQVLDRLSDLTKVSINQSNELKSKLISCKVIDKNLEQSVQILTQSNDLTFTYSPQTGYFIENQSSQPLSSPPKVLLSEKGENRISKISDSTLLVDVKSFSIQDVISEAFKLMDADYALAEPINESISVKLTNSSISDLLDVLLNSTEFDYVELSPNYYVIGKLKSGNFFTTQVIQLQNRTLESVLAIIPQSLSKNLEIKEFYDLNSLVATGNSNQIKLLQDFIKSIDVVVAMVQIDVMLLVSRKSNLTSTGITAGTKTTPTIQDSKIFPEIDVELDAGVVNSLLNSISGFGLVNLGQVTENFYVSLKVLESNNVIDIESTPKISTLNGQTAILSIGETTYYQETQVNVQTSVTQQGVLQSSIWKSIEANLSVEIAPVVSTDGVVTLKIKVNQDDFAGKVDPNAPPNITTQTFESVVRVRNGETILLGGLEKNRKSDTGSGVPFLSRIPLIKWLFSSRNKEREKSKLHILIRPTISY